MKTILIDVDDVLAEFVKKYIEIAEFQLKRKCIIKNPNVWCISQSLGLTIEERALIHEKLDLPGVGYELELVPGSSKAISDLNNMHDIWFVTCSLSTNPTWEFDRRRWFKKHFGQGLEKKIIFAENKQLVQGDYFIDDKIDNLVAWEKRNPNGKALLWNRPYNQILSNTDIIRVNGWNEVFIELGR